MSLRNNDRGSGLAGILVLLCALVATAAVAGLIGAGLFMPAVGAAGATARNGANFFDALPAEFEQSPLAQQSRILAADGSVIATFYNENRIVVPLAKIAPVMQAAQIAIEDSRFREHGGIDPKGVVRAALTNASSGDSQGASTLTQQFVKLTLQENALYAGDEEAAKAAVDKNLARKVSEMKLAVTIEDKMTKDQILEGYLNIAYYGDGAYGVETAARHYFSTTASRLTLPQAAMLAGLVQAPGQYDPRRNPKAALGRRNVVLGRMLATGVIDQKRHDEAAKTKLALKLRPADNGCDGSRYGFFCDYVYKQILSNKAFGARPADRRLLIFRGGLTIRTTLDPKVQKAAEAAIASKVAPTNKSGVAAAMSVVEPGTGKILGMAQSRSFGRKRGQTTVNYNVDHDFGNSGGFQPGSTFKAFTLAAALAGGKSLDDVIDAPPGGTNFPADAFSSAGCWPRQLSKNYGPYNSENRGEVGKFSLRQITADSINTAFVRLESEVGVCKVKSMAENVGMHGAVVNDIDSPTKTDAIRPRPSMTLGAQEVAPLTVAAAYAAFAADGIFCKPLAMTAASTLSGKNIPLPQPSCAQAMDKNVARGVTSALEEVIKTGTAAHAPKIGRPAAGKTGTANLSWATWFTGYVPQLSASVWFGNPQGSKSMKNIDTGKHLYRGQMYGATLSAPIWASFMKRALTGVPVERFGAASDKILHGERVTVPGTTGMAIGDAIEMLEEAGFKTKVGDLQPSIVPAGAVAGSNPPAGSSVALGSEITIYPSTGIPPIFGTDVPTPTIIPDPRKTKDPRRR